MLTGVLREGGTQQNSVEAAAFQARKFRSCSGPQTDERLGIQGAFHYLLRVALAARCHVDNRLCNQLGDRIVSVSHAYVDQGRFHKQPS